MKKVLFYATSAAMAAAMAVPSPVMAEHEELGIVVYCKIVSAQEGVSVGDCVRVFNTSGAVSTCHFFDAIGVLEEMGINMGQCVLDLKGDDGS